MSEDEFPPSMRAQFGVVEQPLVRTNPRSGRRSLYLASHMGRIVGWSQDDSDALIEELMEFATRDRFTYAHKWRDHDLVIWDDSSTMHRATPYPLDAEPRVLRWSAVQEEAPLPA
jgi:alpha-ketoglutarate-dependent 2,4-dichlorophenoxyacetate dioxygenase